MNDLTPDAQSKIFENLLMATIKEQRAKRRWGIFFKLIFIGAIATILLYSMLGDGGPGAYTKHHTAIIKIHDELSADSPANAESINTSLMEAFKNPFAKAIIIELNSPGGSPVQAGEIYDEIMRLKALNPSKKVYGVITDLCASGCYYIAAATDVIYANEASLVGSIGVVFDGFGLVGTMEKVGAQRRVITAGKNKAFLDPFLPLSPEHEAFMHELLAIVHTQFIDKVKAGRGDKLKVDDNLFSGLVWTGQQAVGLGLVDTLASARKVAAEVVKEAEIIDYTQSGGLFEGLGFKGMGSSLKHVIFGAEAAPVMKLR